MSDGITNIPKTRVELHVHLDGSVRHETIWELMKQKNLQLPGNGTFEDLKKALVVRDPVDLAHFLAPFGIYLPALQDDFKAIERIAYEFCEDKANQHVMYMEARYSPHAFLTPKNMNMDNLGEVIASVHRGFQRGERDFGMKVRTILCTLIGNDTAEEVLKLCQLHNQKGIVGIDTAGLSSDTNKKDEVPLNSSEQKAFQEAAKLGIHRTVHAGERGPAEMVRRAVELYQAERIGHGYRVLEDPNIYKNCQNKKIHFECCPWSSFLTGSVPLGVKKHPIAVFADDGVNFSLNTDDTTITGYELTDDYDLARKWSFTEGNIVKTNLNAARSAFLPKDEKDLLIKSLKKNLGFDD
ncbi:UNVERIFIED_CONTAM: hypothetical protein PYX00_003107 [Menopon gallinae]|uniref:adenosine deaminase n=1 Tax=Menopon gallinae TaxID=328185 RepID=A0AAW2HYP1_9NEOP